MTFEIFNKEIKQKEHTQLKWETCEEEERGNRNHPNYYITST